MNSDEIKVIDKSTERTGFHQNSFNPYTQTCIICNISFDMRVCWMNCPHKEFEYGAILAIQEKLK